MKYHSWLLQKYVSLPVDAHVFANDLTLKTCEVEDIIQRKIPEKVVIWKATSVEKHPDADKLSVCQVDCGSVWSYQILTGWENIVANMYIAVAIPGCYLPLIDLQIEARKMRWLDSNGMICSKWELGVNEDEDKHWIWLLDHDFDDLSDSDLGMPLAKKYPRLESFVLDVDNKTITHRPDLTWHFGLAVEARTLYPDAMGTIDGWMRDFSDHTFIDAILHQSEKSNLKIQSQTDKLLCYTLIELSQVSVKQSSFFTRLQLLDLWHTPKNNRVDFSNLFMYLTGQPIHFFDADTIVGDITVRQAKDGEHFVDLADGEHTLNSHDIVIADDEKILALAWVIGGKSSAVSDMTKNIVVEIANFDPVQVRKTWTRLGLRTDAELRFEKYINPVRSLCTAALFRDFLQYFAKDLGDCTVGEQDVWYNKDLVSGLLEKTIDVDFSVVDRVLYGKETDNHAQYTKILTKLWFVLGKDHFSVPVWRSPDDINIQADATEEIARHLWYDTFPQTSMTQEVKRSEWVADVALRRSLEEISVRDLRADQLETYPWAQEKVLDTFGVDKNTLYTINNPLAPEQRYLRNDLVYNLLLYTAKNSKFFDTISVWDFGKVWSTQWSHSAAGKQYASDFVGEKNMRWYMLYTKAASSWENDTMLQAKSAVDHVLHQLWCVWDISFSSTENQNYHPKKQANILCNGVIVWFVGTIHPLILVDYKIGQNAQVSYVWFDCVAIQWLIQKEYKNTFATLQDQIVTRDLCFVIDTPLPWSVVTDAVMGVAWVTDLSVFDLYEWDKLGAGKKSIAFTISIQWENLTTEEINDIMANAIKAVEKVWWKLRE